MAMISRRKTVSVRIGDCVIGSAAPVVVQSMTNTNTADVESTAAQIAALAEAGSEIAAREQLLHELKKKEIEVYEKSK